jgi:hypothetical protein
LSKIEILRQALLELWSEHRESGALPTSNRFLFYELIMRGIIPKHPTGKRRADQDMNEALTDLREGGQIQWADIVDETRSLDDCTGYPSVQEGLLSVLDGIEIDPWNGQAPLILCESRSLAGVLRPLAREYRVRIAATNGQCAGFLHNVVADYISSRTKVLYLGDYDLAANDIEANTRRILEDIAGPLDWERVALTAEQVAFYELPVIVKHDRRFKDGGQHEAVETEALSQSVIVNIVRAKLDELLPESLESVHERELVQRERFRRKIQRR